MTSPDITFFIGGCRSGKSRRALKLAEAAPVEKRLYIATCVPQDDEMRRRVECHQKERGTGWQTLEVPLDLPSAIDTHAAENTLVLVDCLTLWISNLMLEGDWQQPQEADAPIRRLIRSLRRPRGPIVLVSNEVGTGIVPENPLARLYRDVAGAMNQKVAETATRVVWTVAGIPVTIKP
jgi:adenosylcobinamide kinase/adenosylcobinamide-phosphate guanylyltransferase